MSSDDSIEIIEEKIGSSRAKSLCEQISVLNERLWCFSIRGCSIDAIDFKQVMKTLKGCKNVKYLNFNMNTFDSTEKIYYLGISLVKLVHLDTLCLHGTQLKDEGLKTLYFSLANHTNLKSLDIGSCQLTDKSVIFIKELIEKTEDRVGLNELVISNNPKISPNGWTKILTSVANSNEMKQLYLDYNCLDENNGYFIACILCTNQSLEVIDLEHTGITNKTAKLYLYILRNYQLKLRKLNLVYNPVDLNVIGAIKIHLKQQNLINETQQILQQQPTSSKQTIKRTNETSNSKNRPLRKRSLIEFDLEELRNFDKEEMTNSNQSMNSNTGMVKNDLIKRSTPNKNATIGFKDHQLIPNRDPGFLQPVDDLRFRTHHIQPFNL